MAEPRRLRGHKATATCCIASRDRPGIVATTGEDGCICWYDMRCKDVQHIIEVGQQPISSLCFKPGNEDIIFVSSGSEIKCFDVHMASSCKLLQSYNYNKEEINQIACNSKAAFLASSDDSGDVKIIDIRQNCPFKALRAVHTSICSSVQFIPWRPWGVITGGLDSKLVMWDFSKGRPMKIIDFGLPETNASNSAQCFNPAFVHAIAVPDADMLDKSGNVCAVARGDGAVDVIDIESELTAVKKTQKGPKLETKGEERQLHLDYSMGGHVASVSCVAFSLFGEKGRFLVSGGNDKLVKVWEYSRFFGGGQRDSNKNFLHLNINLSKKVNWLCTTPADSENLVVCDTTKAVKVYSVS